MLNSLHVHFFSNPVQENIFSPQNTLQKMLDVEWALAKAQAALNLIPKSTSEAIQSIKPSQFNVDTLALQAVEGSNLAILFVKALTALVAEKDQDAARFVHFGITSQDVIDTALILQLKEAISQIESDFQKLLICVAKFAEQHKSTVMVARTLLQQAMPTTFGFKLATLLDALMRHQQRLTELNQRLFVIQIGGAAGTQAGLGKEAKAITQKIAQNLNLNEAAPFHAYRDRIIEAASVLTNLALTQAKFTKDITLLMQTEIGEVFEGAAKGRGGSSAMPHKRNPALSTTILAASNNLTGLMANLYANALNEHERATGGWQSEWLSLPQIVKIAGVVTSRFKELLESLEVNAVKMLENLDVTFGLIYSEKLKAALAPFIGLKEAHSTLEMLSKQAIDKKQLLKTLLPTHLQQFLTPQELDEIFSPLNAIGEAINLTQEILNDYKTIKETKNA